VIDIPIVDTHLHVWDVDKFSYPWLDDVPALNRTFTLENYNAATKGVPIEKMVFVQCEVDPRYYKEEAEWVTALAKQHDPRIRGIVPWCPLEKGEAVRRELEALAANPLIKGIRRIIQFEPDLEFCLRPDFIRGVQILAEYDLTFDICIDHRHTKVTTQFVDQCPNVQMTLDHIGKPGIKGGLLDPWREEIAELAKRENVWCKVSSLATEADHESWTIDGIRPYVDAIFESFGIDRCFFGGDWPVSRQAATYPVCVHTLDELTTGLSDNERRMLFHDNAERFYHI
jgi:L-fuconolactonase